MPDNITPRFVVGTGRCGSTLLSRMLAKNTEVLSVFEVFSGIDQFFRFKTEPVSGAELVERLRQDHPMLTMTLKRGYAVPEVVYPFNDPSSRFDLGDPIPWVIGIALARINEDPDTLFDELIAVVEAKPKQTLSVHYREILSWLTQKHGKQFWIERSGTSIDYLPELIEFFPGAKFLHIHRDGRECALSMNEYTILRVAVAVMNGLAGDIEFSYEGLTALERDHSQVMDELFKVEVPLEMLGQYWGEQIQRGYAAISQIAPHNYHEIRFEDLVTDTHAVLTDIADFLEIGRGAWIDEATALSKGMPRLRFPELDSVTQAALENACDDAMQLLGHN
jgi:hypothetical protein